MQNIVLSFLYVILFFTGAAGLVFQVTWQKYVSRLLGSDSVATAIILGTFLGGLSLGYYLCGKLSPRIRNHFKAYAVLEGIIGAWCLLFPQIFVAVDGMTRSWSFAPPVLILIQGVGCAALLMGIPTICMGGTIPFLTRGISRNLTEATHVHATVYAVNTTGAFVGTLLAGFYLIPTLGLPVTIMSTAFLNLGACVIVYLMATVLKPVTETATPSLTASPPSADTPVAPARFPAWVLYTIAFLSGFYVMTLENVLIRITNISVGSSSYSFSLIVAVFILAIALGSSIVGRFQRISHQVLCLNQTLITLALLLIYLSLDTWPYWAHLIRIMFQANIVGFWSYYFGIFLALSAVLLIPVAMMGATIPLAFHELKRDLQHVGTHSGLLFSWNTLGNLTGSLIGGIVFYYLLNNARVFLAAALLAAGSAILAGWFVSKKHTIAAGVLGLAVLLCAVITPWYQQEHFMVGTFRLREPLDISLSGPGNFFPRFNAGRNLRFYKDGPTCSVAVIEFPPIQPFPQHPLAIFVNGKSDSDTVRDVYTLKLSAHLSALLAESRKEVMVIGLGTGVTAGELTLYPDVEHIDVAEISPAVVEAFPYFQDFTYHAHTDPRVRMHIGDAFRILGRSDKRWNIVISEPSNPWTTGVDLLFTEEYYKLVKDHLTDDGILVQWTQLYATDPDILGMILNTVQQEFSQCHVFRANPGDLLIIASNKRFTHEDILRAEMVFAHNEHVQTSLRPLNIETFEAMLARQIWTPSYIADHFSGYGIQTMDNPRLHYMAGKSFFLGRPISEEHLLTPASAFYRHEYLLVQKYPDWDDVALSSQTFNSLSRAMRDDVHRYIFPMLQPLQLKAFLNTPARFPLTPEQQTGFNLDLLPFITTPQENDAWELIGLEDASFREKAERLLQHIQDFRNWIVPYPIDGLRALLQEGVTTGRDAYEKNWCALQLALLVLQEHRDREQADAILRRMQTRDNGTIVVLPQDAELLRQVNTLMQRLRIPDEA